MKKISLKGVKLKLNVETIRQLNNSELQRVAGGDGPQLTVATCNPPTAGFTECLCTIVPRTEMCDTVYCEPSYRICG